MDLSLNDNFSVHLDDRNDIATVEGREAFEQSVGLLITDLMYRNVLGESYNIEEKLKLQTTRVVRQHDLIDAVRNVQVSESTERVDGYDVEIFYESGDVSTIEAN